MSVNPNEEDRKKPWYQRIRLDRAHMTTKKKMTIELIEKRADLIVGKIVSGSFLNKEDPRFMRDKVDGRGRKIWGVMFRFKF